MRSRISFRHFRRWTLRTLLLLCIPLCAGLAYYGHVHRQRQHAIDAFQLMLSKGVDANFGSGFQRVVYTFKNGNVTDADLVEFVPAFNGHAPAGFGRVVVLRLSGSNVSTEAVRRFRETVPDCQLEF